MNHSMKHYHIYGCEQTALKNLVVKSVKYSVSNEMQFSNYFIKLKFYILNFEYFE